MLGARLATAAVAIPLLLAIVFVAPPAVLSCLILVLGLVALAEYLGMALQRQRADQALGFGCGALVMMVAVWIVEPGLPLAAALTTAVAGLLAGIVLRPVDLKVGVANAALSVMGILYVTILAHFVWLRHLDGGPYWITFIIANGMSSDTGAYFAGKSFGRRKLMPRVSPGKTVEGAVGSLVTAAVAGAVCQKLLFPAEAVSTMVVLAILLAAVGQLGDLCESALKRAFDTKESGWIFPGHGGVLDRIDSLLFPVAILYYYRVSF